MPVSEALAPASIKGQHDRRHVITGDKQAVEFKCSHERWNDILVSYSGDITVWAQATVAQWHLAVDAAERE